MAFVQLNPPIPLHVLGKGKGYAIGVIDYGQEHNLIWVTAINATGEIWCAPNPKVRMEPNWTMGRAKASDTAGSTGEVAASNLGDVQSGTDRPTRPDAP